MGTAPPLCHESPDVKTNITKIGAVLLVGGICLWCSDLRAQATTTTTAVTTTNGAFTEFVPGSETIVVTTEGNTAPLRYVVNKQTTIVDEAGAPIAVERISPGQPVVSAVHGAAGDRLVASRIVVRKAPVGAGRYTTTTTTTRPLTHDEKEALEERREERKEQLEKEIEHRKKALEKAKDAEEERLEKLKDKLDDDN